MITFKQQFTFPEESVKNFALYLGWQEKVTIYNTVETESEFGINTTQVPEEIDNPQGFAEYVDEKAKAHSLAFTKSYAEHLKQEEINRQVEELRASIEPTLEAQMITPVIEALQSEII
jgi:hypothetical protein